MLKIHHPAAEQSLCVSRSCPFSTLLFIPECHLFCFKTDVWPLQGATNNSCSDSLSRLQSSLGESIWAVAMEIFTHPIDSVALNAGFECKWNVVECSLWQQRRQDLVPLSQTSAQFSPQKLGLGKLEVRWLCQTHLQPLHKPVAHISFHSLASSSLSSAGWML